MMEEDTAIRYTTDFEVAQLQEAYTFRGSRAVCQFLFSSSKCSTTETDEAASF